MPTADYHLLDVFTEAAFSGNQLAVLVDPPPMSTTAMQNLAAEFNLSETIFVSSPEVEGGSWTTRIFTPGSELPFAGHPTIGASVLLAQLGRVGDEVVLAEGAGDVAVTIDRSGPVTRATLRSPRLPEHLEVVDPEVVTGVLGLDLDDLEHGKGPSGWSCGVGFAVVPLRDLDALGRCEVDLGRWMREMAGNGPDHLYPIVVDTLDPSRVRVRMFAPGMGIVEDPATGAAAAALAGHLLGRSTERGPFAWTLEQGIEMGRPSTIEVAARVENGQLHEVTVGGPAVVVGSGTITVPT